MSAPKPIATGDLGQRPLGHVLISIEKRALSGTLAIWPGSPEAKGQDRLLFEEGRVLRGRFVAPMSTFAHSALELFHRKSAYAFYREDLVGSGDRVQEATTTTLGLLAASLRGRAPKEAMARTLERFRNTRMRIKTGADIAALGLDEREERILSLLRAEPNTPGGLIELSGEPKKARRLFYLLTITGRLSEAGESEPGVRTSQDSRGSGVITLTGDLPVPEGLDDLPTLSDPPPPMPAEPSAVSRSGHGQQLALPDPPGDLSPDDAERWREIIERAGTMERQNYFEMLGIPEAADDAAVNGAYVSAIKRLHPDRLPPTLAPIREAAQHVFHWLTEAKNALANGEGRFAHLKEIRAGGGTPEADRQMESLVGAAMEFQKAEVLIRRRNYEEALEVLDVALAAVPDEPDYLAMRAFALFSRGDVREDAGKAEIRQLVNQALEKRPDHEMGTYVDALLLKLDGDGDAAYARFKRIAEKNKKHIEAQREVRLYEMRKRAADKSDDSPDDEGGGLLSRFKRLKR